MGKVERGMGCIIFLLVGIAFSFLGLLLWAVVSLIIRQGSGC